MPQTDRLAPQPWMTAPETREVMRALAGGGAAARFVGGCVRDALLGRKVEDIDIATTATPAESTRLLEEAGIKVVPTGIDHGTVTAVCNRRHYEITTLRRDVETFGRHARVEFTDDWRADAARRDFTINALYCDADGALFDPFGGRADLEAARVRFVGDAAARLDEDILRLFRFFRFFAWYGRPPADAAALEACRAKREEVAHLSGERVRKEMLRLLEAPDPAPVIALMAENGLLLHWLPEYVGERVLAALSAIERAAAVNPDAIRRLAALVPQGVPTRALAERWRLSAVEAERLAGIVAEGERALLADGEAALRRRIYAGGPLFADRLLLAWAAARVAGESEAGYADALDLARRWQVPALPIRGADVVALGQQAGPEIGRMLREIEAWWIDGDFAADRAACLAELRRRLGAAG